MASYPMHCDAVSRRDDTKTIKPITNKAFVAASGNIITDYNYFNIFNFTNLPLMTGFGVRVTY